MKIKLKRKLKKSQAFYIVKFFYYFLLILPVLIYLIGIKIFIGEKEIKINEDSYEIKSLLLLLPPERAIITTKGNRLMENIKDFFSNKEKNNFVQTCFIQKNIIGKDEIICDYKFVK